MNNQALEFLKNTFTSNTTPSFSNNPDGIDELIVERRAFLNFIKEQERTFMCTFQDRSSHLNNRHQKNKEYLNGSDINSTMNGDSERSGRPSPLFVAVRVFFLKFDKTSYK
jgi:hypothetical protein